MDPGTAGAIGGMIVGAVIPIVSIIGGLAFAAYALWVKARLREMQHRERLAMIEKGLVPPPEPRWEEMDYQIRSARRRSSGIFVLLLGIGLAVTLGAGLGQGVRGYSIGGFVAFIGLAQLIVGMVEQRSRHNATMLRPDSQPPAR